jgi:hypothetical protein
VCFVVCKTISKLKHMILTTPFLPVQKTPISLIPNLSIAKGSRCQKLCAIQGTSKTPQGSEEGHLTPLELIHFNICKMNGVLTEGGQRYFMTMIDDVSRYSYVSLLKMKDKALNCFQICKF